MHGKKRLWENLKLLNPRNLEKEVHIYGYHFSWKSHVLLITGTLAGISAVGFLFRLKPVCFSAVVLAVLIVLPILVLDMYRKMYEQKRFADAASYMEQMLYSFQKTGKVISALKESREIFDGGQMRQVLDVAIFHLEAGRAGNGQRIHGESLEIIEEAYRCTKIHLVHDLLINAEEYGGEVDESILFLLEDVERWKQRGYRLQAEKKRSHTDNIISILVATMLCAVALYVLDAMKQMFSVQSPTDVFQIQIIQISSVLFILFLLHVFVKSTKNLTDDWLKDTVFHETDYIEKSYDMIAQYDEKKERRKSILFSVPAFLVTVILFVAGKRAICLVSLSLFIFLLLQHKTGYYLAKKDVTEEMYLALPQWLTGMALLLQNNNVQVSIVRSMGGAAPVLQKELRLLTERLKESPGKLQAYTGFCSEFDLPEVQSCMKMLHAIAENGAGNIRIQMGHLLERVGKMQGMADEIENEKTAFRMKLLFSYPVAAATVKLLTDLTVGMVLMLKMLAVAGGM